MSAWRAVVDADAPALAAALAPHPVEGVVFTSALLEAREHGFELGGTGLYADFGPAGEVRAIATTRRTLELFAPDPAAWEGLAAFVAPRLAEAPVLIGAEPVVDFVMARVGAGPGPLESDRRLALLALEPDAWRGPLTEPGFRPATPADILAVTENAADMATHETGQDPRLEDFEGFLRGIAWQILNGRVFVLEHEGAIVYQVVLGRWTPEIAVLEGAWTPPAGRGQGFGKRGWAAASHEALGRSRRALAATRVDNAPQLAIEAATGFQRLPVGQRVVVWAAHRAAPQ